MKTVIITIAYLITGLTYIVFKNQIEFYPALILKSVLIPQLILILHYNLGNAMNRLSLLVVAGLIFSTAGDLSIEFSFMAGLVFFMMTHIMYLTAFFLTKGENTITGRGIFLVFPILLYGSSLILYMYNDLDRMRAPVIFYSVVILTMLAAAVNRMKKVNRTSFLLVLSGAILFILSDSLIAVNRFSFQFQAASPIIMSTYLAGQYLITFGFIRQYRTEMN